VVTNGTKYVLSLPVNPDVSPSLLVGVEVAHYQEILSERGLVKERTVNMKRGISIRVAVEIEKSNGSV